MPEGFAQCSSNPCHLVRNGADGKGDVLKRLAVAIVLILGVMVAGLPAASGQEGWEGSHLAEDLASEGTAVERLKLADVSSFHDDGGEAVVEPNTASEEQVTYGDVDRSSNELLGIERTAPVAHVEGAVIESLPLSEASPDPTSSPTPEPTSSAAVGPTAGPAPSPSESIGTPGSSVDLSNPGAEAGLEPSEDDSVALDPVASTSTSAADLDVPAVILFDDASYDAPVGYQGIHGFRVLNQNLEPVSGARDFTATVTGPNAGIYSGIVSGGRGSFSYRGSLPGVDLLSVVVGPAVGNATRSYGVGASTTPATVVLFDDAYIGGGVGCGLVGFTAYSATLARAQNRPYTVTAITNPTASLPQTFSGTTDSSGRAVISYCPPPGLLTGPIEVTFTATVDVATATAVRAWQPNIDAISDCEDTVEEVCDPRDDPIAPCSGCVPFVTLELSDVNEVGSLPGLPADTNLADDEWRTSGELWYGYWDSSGTMQHVGKVRVSATIDLDGRTSYWLQDIERLVGPSINATNAWGCREHVTFFPDSNCGSRSERDNEYTDYTHASNDSNAHEDAAIYYYKFRWRWRAAGYDYVWKLPSGSYESERFFCGSDNASCEF